MRSFCGRGSSEDTPHAVQVQSVPLAWKCPKLIFYLVPDVNSTLKKDFHSQVYECESRVS